MKDRQLLIIDAYDAVLSDINGVSSVAKSLGQGSECPQYVIAIGKAAESMLRGAYQVCPSMRGLLITAKQYYSAEPLPAQVSICLGSHPLPDAGSIEAGRALLSYIDEIPQGAKVLFLISGGASAMVEVPVDGVLLEDLQRVNRWLLSSGLKIDQMNTIRKTLSRIKDGGLLDYLDHRVIEALYISDVYPDDPAVIGSGLLCRSPGQGVSLEALPDWICALLPDREEPAHDTRVSHRIIASAEIARRYLVKYFARHYAVFNHPEYLFQEVGEVAERLAAYLGDAPKGVHLWSGEPVVKLPRDAGRGGRMTHLALLLARHLEQNVTIACLSTDGQDGGSGVAGAIIDSDARSRGEDLGLDIDHYLQTADSASYLEKTGNLVEPRITGTNVTDLIIVLNL